jgi:plasmid maintenance system antidote protein VapI
MSATVDPRIATASIQGHASVVHETAMRIQNGFNKAWKNLEDAFDQASRNRV